MNASSSSDDGWKDIDNADLYDAARKGSFETFRDNAQNLHLLMLGKNKNTILHVHLNSPCKRSKEFVEKVLGQCPQLLWQPNNNGVVLLHIAAKYRHLEIVKVFIEEAKKQIHRDLESEEEEADSIRRMLRLTNKQKETALHLAIGCRCIGVVEEILKHEDPKFTYTANISGESPLYLAVHVNTFNEKIAIEILKKFDSPECGGPNGTTVFHAAALYSYYDESLLDLMLSKVGSFVNQADESGWTPLHCAAYKGNLKFVSKILSKDKSSAYATDKDRCRTALHMASCRGNVGVMKEIIEKCPECCEMSDVRGWNVIHYAVITKSDEAVKVIFKYPSLVYLIAEPDVKGYTPLYLLLVYGRSSWFTDPKINYPTAEGYTNYFVVELMFAYLKKRNSACLKEEDEDRTKEEILEWTKDLGRGPMGSKIKITKDSKELQKEINEKVIPELEKAKESHLVAAALVATVTFAAAFTLPGGYISDENDPNLKGTPILSRNAAFQAFVVTDAIAMVLSTSSVFIHFIMVLLGYKQRYYWLMRSAFWFVVLAMGAMVVAFVTGTYAVLAPNSMGLAVATCVIGLTFFLHVSYTIIRLVFHFIKRDRDEYYNPSTTESLSRLLESAPGYLSWGRNRHKEDE